MIFGTQGAARWSSSILFCICVYRTFSVWMGKIDIFFVGMWSRPCSLVFLAASPWLRPALARSH